MYNWFKLWYSIKLLTCEVCIASRYIYMRFINLNKTQYIKGNYSYYTTTWVWVYVLPDIYSNYMYTLVKLSEYNGRMMTDNMFMYNGQMVVLLNLLIISYYV